MFSGQIEFEPSKPDNVCQPQLCQPQLCHSQLCQQFEYQNNQLRLRQPTAEDAPELFALVEANRTRLRQWLPWLDDNTTVAHSQQFIQRMQERAENNQGFAALVCHQGAIAGLIDLHGVNWHNRTASIGYWLNQNDEGKGLMSHAVEIIIHYAFTALELNRIEILCATQNSRSRAIPKRLNFTHEGTLRQCGCLYGQFVDHELYALLKQDWVNHGTNAAEFSST